MFAEIPENIWGYGKRLRFMQEQIARHFPGSRPRILEVGCGNGSQIVIPLAKAGYRVLGVDPDQASIEHGLSMYPAASLVQCTVDKLEPQKFEVIIVSEVIEHLQKPESLILDCLSYLAPGGLLIVTTPNGYGQFEIDSAIFRALHLGAAFDWFFRTVRKLRGRPEPEVGIAGSDDKAGHVQRFTLPSLNRMFRELGLSTIDTRGACLICGPTAAYFVARFPSFVSWNTRIVDRLPLWMASGWYFVLQATS